MAKTLTNLNKKKYIYFFALLAIVITIEVSFLVAIVGVKRKDKMQDAYIYAQSVASAIQMTLENTLEASEALKYFYLEYGEECFNNFDSIARNISLDNPVIGSMYIAPEGIIRVAYPKEVNESTIGFEMLKDPDQGPRAQLAVDTRMITVAGPHALIEGGTGFIIRNPVFDGDRFVGFTIIVLDWDAFVQRVLDNVPATKESYKLGVKKESIDRTGIIDDEGYIFKNTSDSIQDSIDISFSVPNDTWHLVIQPTDGWLRHKDMSVEILTSFIIASLVFAGGIMIYTSNERKRELQIKEADDVAKNLYMEQLTDALEKAKQADAAKSEFLSRMSHDIRTPLNGIIGLLDINEKHSDDRELVDENRSKMKVAANHLLSLISDVLELSKMENEDVKLAHDAFNIDDLSDDVLTITQLRASESGILLKPSEDLKEIQYPYVYGSPLHVRQIFINIFSNAIKYNKPNGSITYNAELVEYDGRRVVYRVIISDTGIGMSKEFQDHMFEPFSQEHSDARSTYQGTGLGMAIVKKLVDKMNGDINVRSELGVGTTFTITLPFDVADEEIVKKKNSPAGKVNLSGKNVLVVEDNEINMVITKAIVIDAGASVVEAYNGKEAVEIYKSNPPGTFDLILMDILMPIMDGMVATRKIRESRREDSQSIPIIAMTANAFAEDVRECLQAGMNGHVAKPVDIDKMMMTLAEVLHEEIAT